MSIKQLLLITSAVVGFSPAAAQVAVPVSPAAVPQDEAQGGIEDIVVTAQRRSENLQDVPVAVSAVTSTQLAQSGVKDLTDLKLAVPTLNLTNSNGYLTSSLRGIGSNATGPGIENPIATYIDGVYYGSPAASLLSLSNVEQVEVLKGPQGTLFGRNATGGLIQVTTRTPDSTPRMNFDVSYANYDTVTANAYVGSGLGDAVAADVAVHYSHANDGWGRNLANGDDVYKIDRDFAVRSKWVFKPAEGTKITVIGDFADLKGSMNAFRTLPGTVNGFNPARGPEPDYGWDSNSTYTSNTRNKSGGVSLKWEQEIGELDFASITAYRKSTANINFDYDGTNDPLHEQILTTQRDRQLSQELQLTNRSGGPFTWVLGAFYFDARASYDPAEFDFYDLGAIVSIFAKQRTRSVAGYGQGTYEIADRTHVTLGARYTSEKRETYDGRIETFVIPLNVQAPDTTAPDRRATFNKFTFRVSLDHRFSDEVLAYASMNRGFKSGGFNTANIGTDPYRPEQIDAYEVGLKTDLFDRRIRLNLAGFYYDYQDIQIQLLNQGSIGIINAGSAKVYGLDAELQVAVSDRLRLTSGLGWTSPKFDRFPACQISTPRGGTPVSIGPCDDNQIPLASKLVANAAINYEIPFADDSSLAFNGNVYYNSGFYTESDNVIRQKRYAQLGALITYTASGGRLSVSAFGKNLTNQRVLNFASTIPNGTHTGFYQAPRTYGVTLGYKL